MKKNFVSVLSVILTMFCVISCMQRTAYSASQRKIHKAYEKVIRSENKRINQLSWAKNSGYFAYYDINGDGVDELFIQCMLYDDTKNKITTEGGTDVIIYTFVKNKPKKLQECLSGGGNWGGWYFYKDSHYLEEHLHEGWSNHEYVFKKLKGGKFVKAGECAVVAKDFSDYEAGYFYKVNGKNVKKKTYESYMKKMSGKTGLTMYKIKETNMKKLR